MNIPAKISVINPAKLRDAINLLIDYLYSARAVAGSGIIINKLPGGTIISAKNAVASAGAGVEQVVSTGPFSIVSVGGTVARLVNSDSWNADSQQYDADAGLVYVGDAILRTPAVDLAAGYVWIEVTHNGYQYVATVHQGNDIPAGDANKYIEIIGQVIISDGVIRTQMSRVPSDISVRDRWV